MSHCRRPRSVLAAVLALVLGWTLLAAPQLGYAADQVAFRLTDRRITAPAGLARNVDGAVYWTANRTGTRGRVFGVDDNGRTVGTLDYRADPVDVEALAFARRKLFVGDIGDPSRQRRMITVYVLTEPSPSGLTVPYNSFDFSYPDGPHDAAAMAVDARGRILVVTKEAKGGVYVAPASPSAGTVNRLVRVADAPAYVTDATVLPDRRLALRTYVALYVLDPTSYATVASAAVPFQSRGESVSPPLAGTGLLLGNRSARSSVLLVPIPTTTAAVPSAGATPPPRASASTSARASAAPAEEDDGQLPVGPAPRGTLTALVLAAVVAVAAGLVAALARSRRS